MTTTETIETRTVELYGISYRIDIEPDYDSTPCEDDRSVDDIAAWKRKEWQYVGVFVTPIINGDELRACADRTWGVMYGKLPGNPELNMDTIVNTYPFPDMLSFVNDNLRALRTKLFHVLNNSMFDMPKSAQAEDKLASTKGVVHVRNDSTLGHKVENAQANMASWQHQGYSVTPMPADDKPHVYDRPCPVCSQEATD